MTSQLTVSLHDNIFELIQTLGEPALVVPAALRQYVVDRSLQRVESAEQRIRGYEQRYKTDYHSFNQRVTTDQTFLDQLNRENPMWESDAIEWASWTEEVELWRERLTQAFQMSSPLLVTV